jgi:hypothetical protein
MTNADTGFFLAYRGTPLSKTADGGGLWWDTNRPRPKGWKRYAAAGSAGGAVGLGISALWGKLADKPDMRRDLFMLMGGALGGIAGDAATGLRWGIADEVTTV